VCGATKWRSLGCLCHLQRHPSEQCETIRA
jgi:hypothetical protein